MHVIDDKHSKTYKQFGFLITKFRKINLYTNEKAIEIRSIVNLSLSILILTLFLKR